MTSDVQDAMAEVRDELSSEGMERMRHLDDDARRRGAAAPAHEDGTTTSRNAIALAGLIALVAIVAGVIIWSRMSTPPRSREEEFLDRSREAFERTRETLDALLARLPDAA